MGPEIKWLEEHSTYAAPPHVAGSMDKDVAGIIERDICPPKAPEPPPVEPEHVTPTALLADWAEYMREILTNPTAASIQHGKNLKWGRYKTSRVKTELMAAGLIDATKQNTAGRPSDQLSVTRKGIVSLEAMTANDNK